MFYSLTGKVVHMQANMVVLECGGVGFKCLTTMHTISHIPSECERVTLFTYLHVREDALELFGFISQMEQNYFLLLLGVSGVGPKAALAILSQFTPENFALAVAAGDAKSITRAPGVGPKLAQRIILELKDKIQKSGIPAAEGAATIAAAASNENIQQACDALVVLGYSQSEAMSVLAGCAPDMSVEEMIKQGLKFLAGKV